MSKQNPQADSSKKKASSPLVVGYLVLYNAIQVVGWSYLLYQLTIHYLSGKPTSELWKEVKCTVMIFQNAAVLEVVNVAMGFVRSNLAVTTMQVASRVMVVCGLMAVIPTVGSSFGLPLALFCWGITEVIRYSMYAIALLAVVPYPLLWARYTFFYALYPIGVTGELLCYYAAQLFVGESKMWSIEMPNSINFTFSYHYLLLIIMLSYIPLFPQMYFHMISQRRKIIGGGGKEKSKVA